jgi:hypothetical protein
VSIGFRSYKIRLLYSLNYLEAVRRQAAREAAFEEEDVMHQV